MKQILIDLDFNSAATCKNLPSPSASGDAANKAYVDSAVEGLNWKDSCRVASVSNINLSAPGSTIDGVTMATNDRFMAKDQTAGAENGIYIWNGAAVAATRSSDMNTAAEVEQAVSSVEEGTSAGSTFRQTQVNVTLGTTPLIWTSFGTSAPAASETTPGIAELATQAETDTGTDDLRIVTPLKLTNWSGRKRKATATIGDGSATSFNLDHNFGTRDVTVEVYRNSGSYDTVTADVTRPSTNRVTVAFAVAPGVNAFNVVVLG